MKSRRRLGRKYLGESLSRDNKSEAAERAMARSYPRARCEETAKPNYTYRSQDVPTCEPIIIGKWSVSEMTKDVPANRKPIRLKDPIHKAIREFGTRRRYTDYKICVLQVLSASKQTPHPSTPFANEGEDTYWVQTTMQLHEDGSLPFLSFQECSLGCIPLTSFGKFLGDRRDNN